MIEIQELQSEAEFREAYPVMRELRTSLSEAEYFALLAEMRPAGYRLLALRCDGRIAALAGIGRGVNFYDGRHIYVYDLITSEGERSRGYGEQLLSHVEELARREGCGVVTLCSGVQRADAHRFYQERMGYAMPSYVFKKTL